MVTTNQIFCIDLTGMTKTQNVDHSEKWEKIVKWRSNTLKLVLLMNVIAHNISKIIQYFGYDCLQNLSV